MKWFIDSIFNQAELHPKAELLLANFKSRLILRQDDRLGITIYYLLRIKNLGM